MYHQLYEHTKNDVTAFFIAAELSKMNEYRELSVFIVKTQRLSHVLSVLLQFRFFHFLVYTHYEQRQ